jgi:thioredoxin 1
MKSKGVSFMNKAMKIVIVVALIVVVSVVIAIKQKDKASVSEPAAAASSNQQTMTETTANLPRMVDLGANKCIPCKMMKPILDELRQNYKNSFQVIFIDVWENPDQAKKYNIKLIPTQIFYDSSGKELFRHEGFFSKEDILGKWKEFGINLEKGTQNESN